MSKRHRKKKRVEWSKTFASLIALGLGMYGVWCGIKYYALCQIAIESNSMMPDPTLAVVCVSTVIASLLSYLLYQAGLKNSRNKYGIDADGQPFKRKEQDIDELQVNISSENSNQMEDLR